MSCSSPAMSLILRRPCAQNYSSIFAKRSGPRRAASKLGPECFKQETPLAKQLGDTKVWTRGKAPAKGKDKDKGKGKGASSRPKGDKKRINIVSEKLCDDIIQYLGPSLTRHVGCDLVDINPGAGLWSRKLHDALQPRSHILMEPEDELYRPFLEPILSRPNTQLIPQSGILWKELNQVLGHVKNQRPQPRGADTEPQRNDTLLVTANLSFFPKKSYGRFNSIAPLVLYQLLNSIQTGTLFQNYGLVRMLVWMGWDDHLPYLTKSIANRKTSSLEAEFTCEWMAEVAGKDITSDVSRFPRDRWIELHSRAATLSRMKEAGFKIPEGRKMSLTRQAEEQIAVATPQAGMQPPSITRRFHSELQELERAAAADELEPRSKAWKRLIYLRNQSLQVELWAKNFVVMQGEIDELTRLYEEGSISSEEFAARAETWNKRVEKLRKNDKIDFRLSQDNLHVFRQDPTVLLWDRRPYEPLAVEATEFFPNVECGLLDIQPKAVHPLLREMGPGSSRAGDIFELMRRSLSMSGMLSLEKSLDRLWPGAAEGVLPNCPSLRDPKKGGRPGTGDAGVTVRVLTQEQWIELLEAFMAWPFRPSYEELIGRLVESGDAGVEEDDAPASGNAVDATLTQ